MGIKVRKTKQEAPLRVLVHGAGGVGKSTFAASAPSPVFLAAEDGLSNIDAQALEEPADWAAVLGSVEQLTTERHAFRTLCIDSLDWLEPLCWAHVCKAAKKPDIEAFGYGKGYVAALDQWRVFYSRLERLRAVTGMGIVMIAHSVRKPVRNPTGDDYESWQIKLHTAAAGLVLEWCDVVGFAQHDVGIDTSSGRGKAFSTGKRVLCTQPAGGYVAKTRFHLPATLPLDWAAFEAAVAAGRSSPVERLEAALGAKLAELANEEVEKGARAFVASRGVSVASLSDAIATVDAYLAEQRKAG